MQNVEKRSARVTIGERLLRALSRDPAAPDYPTKTAQYTLSNALEFVRKTIPHFDDLIRDKLVLDYGCGHGYQGVAMRQQCGARQVFGLDINENWLAAARALAEGADCADAVTFGRELPHDLRGRFDAAVSISSFEHFTDPARSLADMRDAVRPGGLVLITFAEPWYSHSGSHMVFFTKVPWVNLWFSEATVMRVRARYRSDGATRYEDIESGLNRMTLAKFERIIKASGMRVEFLKYYPTRGLPLMDKIPLARELLVSAATCVLRRVDEPAAA